MRTHGSITRIGAGGLGLLALGALAGNLIVGLGASPAAGARAAVPDGVALGKEIFHREWLPGDGRGHGGDGLGPVYNDTSCIACHNSGGPGGGGPNSKNIDILSAASNRVVIGKPVQANEHPRPPDVAAAMEPLVNMHAGFRDGRTVVLHKFGIDPNYDSWRRSVFQNQGPVALGIGQTMVDSFEVVTSTITAPAPIAAAPITVSPKSLSTALVPQPESRNANPPVVVPTDVVLADQLILSEPVPDSSSQGRARLQETRMTVVNAAGRQPRQFGAGGFTVSRSQRNPSALFGLGLIDKIPDKAIEEAASRRDSKFPEVQGRVSRLKDGRIGRLGWKGQTASVEDFVLTACAVELGLEVPGHHQAISPQAPKYQATGMDLTAQECSALVAYVASLPRPMERRASAHDEIKALSEGRALFASVGCASCHAPSLGGVDGIFSDLLLHDMGSDLGDTGSYNGNPDDDTLNPVLASDGKQPAATPVRGATRQEWRTPPLWGFRDSGPYLHDGRAETLDQAVSVHGGQGAASAQRYFDLSPTERRHIEMFLKSLVAPVDDEGHDG